MAFNKNTFFVSLAAFVAGFSMASATYAQLYKWTDENGKVHYSDSIPPTANDRARTEMRRDGTVKKEVERALTPEERRIAAQKAAAEAAERAVKEERERKDKALLATYSSLADFDRVRDRAVSLADGEIAALKRQEQAEVEQRAEVQKKVDAAGPKGPTPKLKADLDSADKDLTAVRTMLDRKTKDRTALVGNFTTERSRLADLIAAENAAKTAAIGTASAKTATPTSPANAKAK